MTGNSLLTRLQKLKDDPFFEKVMMAAFIIMLVEFAINSYLRGGVDFRGYYAAATLVLRGGNPYDFKQLAPVLQEITGYMGNNPYYYPPWFCLFFIPLALIPFQIARAIWLIINLLLLYFGLENIREVFGWPLATGWQRWGIYAISSFLFALNCLRSEQSGILIFWGLSLVFLGIHNKQPALTGLGLVIAITKPNIVLFAIVPLLIWLFVNQRQSIYWMAIFASILIGLSSFLIPRWWEFDHSNFGNGLTISLDGPDTQTGIRVTSTLHDFLEYQLNIQPAAWLVVTIVVFFTFLVIWLAIRTKHNDLFYLTGLGLLYTLLITPYAISYDYVPVIVFFFWVLKNIEGQSMFKKRMIAAGTVLMLLTFPFQEYAYTGYLMMPILLAMVVVVKYNSPVLQANS